MKSDFLKKFFILGLGFAFLVSNMPKLSADEATSEMSDTIDMVSGDVQTIAVNNLTRVSVTNPDVADISDAVSDKVSILGKKSGETVLFLWDSGGKRNIKIRVVNEDLSSVKTRVQKVLNEANITGVTMEENHDVGRVVVSGAMSREDKERLEDILQPYAENLLDLVKVEKNEDLIQVDMQVVEIQTSYEKNLGFLWGNINAGTVTPGTVATTSGNNGQVALGYGEKLPQEGKFKDLFKIGNFQRTTPLQVTVNALVQEGKARLISKPRLVVVSGKQASFLVGGEIPISTTTTNTTGSTLTQNTTYSQYGVNMTVTPTMREGKIDVLLNVDIRDIDAAHSTTGSVAFITRTAQTDLMMDNNQTIALAGLIKYSDGETLTEVPFLSKVPVLGALFRNRQTPQQDNNTEMVIILTPTVLTNKRYADNQLVMPTPAEKASYKEIDSRYEHEPMPAWPVVKPVPVVPATQNTDTGYSTIMSYARMVQQRISQNISYPKGSLRNFMAGVVKLKLHILKNGTLDSAVVTESSGNVLLDQDAMQAAKRAAPYDAFITGMDQQDLVFTIPIVYNRLIPKEQAPMEKVIVTN